MKLLYPACLCLLLAIPLLLILNMLRGRDKDKVIPSTFLWRQSERFRKKRQNIRRIKKLLQVLLKGALVILAVFLCAGPRIRMAGSGRDFVAVVDISASMAMEGKLDEVREALLADLKGQPAGTAVTIITAGSSAQTLLSRSRSLTEAERAAARLATDWSTGVLAEALVEAQSVLSRRGEAETVVYTDKEAETDGLRLVSVTGKKNYNASITGFSDVTQERRGPGSKGHTFKVEVASYGRAVDLTLALYLDGRLDSARNISLSQGESMSLTWDSRQDGNYKEARAAFLLDDALAEDNSAVIVPETAHAIRVLVCSDSPFYWESLFGAFGEVDTDIRGAAGWEDELSGYDIYLLDGSLPRTMPQDGTIILSNPERLPRETGLLYGQTVAGGLLEGAAAGPEEASSSLLSGLSLKNVMVQKLRQVSDTERFSVVLTAGGYPALLSSRGSDGLAFVVMPFDIHDTNLPMSADFVVLMHNILSYAMPDMLPGTAFASGETISGQVLPLTSEIYLESPDGTLKPIPYTSAGFSFTAGAPGRYTLLQNRSGGGARLMDFTVAIPSSERESGSTRTSLLALSRETASLPDWEEELEEEEGMLDIRFYLAGILLVLLILEWAVYYHEQY